MIIQILIHYNINHSVKIGFFWNKNISELWHTDRLSPSCFDKKQSTYDKSLVITARQCYNSIVEKERAAYKIPSSFSNSFRITCRSGRSQKTFHPSLKAVKMQREKPV